MLEHRKALPKKQINRDLRDPILCNRRVKTELFGPHMFENVRPGEEHVAPCLSVLAHSVNQERALAQ